MTQKRAIAVLMIGCAMVLGSCALLARTALQYFAPNIAATIPIDIATAPDDHTLELEADSLARLVYQIQIATASVQEQAAGDDIRYVGRYLFPLHYTVRDSAGEIVAEETRTLDWRQVDKELAQSISEVRLGLSGGTLMLEAALRSFRVPSDGRVTIAASLASDAEYGARAEALSLRVEQGLHEPLLSIVFAVILLAFGVVTSVIAFVLVVTQTASASPMAADGAALAHDDNYARQVAMACHLGGFAGYVVPFGNFIVPLIIWMLNRNKHPYIDEQGKEAINFQLTVFTFTLLSLALVLVVVGFVLLPMLMIWHLVFMVVGGLRAWEGKAFRYPLTLRFVA